MFILRTYSGLISDNARVTSKWQKKIDSCRKVNKKFRFKTVVTCQLGRKPRNCRSNLAKLLPNFRTRTQIMSQATQHRVLATYKGDDDFGYSTLATREYDKLEKGALIALFRSLLVRRMVL